jgi:XTP/dITP diphosphohydrolase
MPAALRTVIFASTNENKFVEARDILSSLGISVDFARVSLVEVQSDSLEEIAREKAKSAFAQICRPALVEDDGLFVNALGGFPGPYSSYVFQTIGNEGLLKLLEGKDDRTASFRSVVAYFDGSTLSISEGIAEGSISKVETDGGWGYDPVFIPDGSMLTFAQLKADKKKFSHRKKGLEKFAKWLLPLAPK